MEYFYPTGHREIGAVVIGRNEGERLTKCLSSVQSVCKRIVYVDSGSTDGSAASAQKFGALVINLDPRRPFTAARARNEGFFAIKDLYPDIKFVQFIDGDCTLDESWINHAYNFIASHSDVAGVCGRRREQFPLASVFNLLCDIEWNTPIGEAKSCGGDALFRTQAFEAAGGYRESLIAGEEPELCVRLRERGWKIWRINAEMTRHDAAITRIRQWWLRSVRCGYAYAQVSTIHKRSQFRIWHRETLRAVFWGGVLPLGILILGVMNHLALYGYLVYLVQVFRLAASRGLYKKDSWLFAIFVTAAKFPEFEGIIKYYIAASRQQPISVIEYK
jgi:glycosyltransferase involved in cell wall biosynthesis